MRINYLIECLLSYLDDAFPTARCELEYTKDYELVIAVMLSAQTTDKAVNRVTNRLFFSYNSLESLANANTTEIEKHIKTLGLFHIKAKNIIQLSQKLINDYHSILPCDKKELQSLPGIGNKSAGVIRAEVFGIPDLPVDTHILRVCKRLELVSSKATPIEVELFLKRHIDKNRWIKTHHQLIHFGRYQCLARSPKCKNCQLSQFCQK